MFRLRDEIQHAKLLDAHILRGKPEIVNLFNQDECTLNRDTDEPSSPKLT